MDMVDSNGLLPLRAGGRLFGTAASFRRHMQRAMPDLLAAQPTPSVKVAGRAVVPAEICRRWPAVTTRERTSGRGQLLAELPIDHGVRPVATRGGATEAGKRLADFIKAQLATYAIDRDHPDRAGTSGLSPYLHFGHLSAHRMVREILASRGFDPTRLGAPKGQREGFWGLDAGAEAVLDQLLVWRELAFNFAHYAPLAGKQLGHFEALPEWSRKSLVAHAADPRPYVYTHKQFEDAQTDDPLWNAAQRQLVHEGTIHNALRMLWGKKILEWSPDPVTAHRTMLVLNNRWALDGRDPNSNAGIGWILGRYDRPWGPRRPIFGLIRFMSSASTSRKRKVRAYLERYGPQVAQLSLTKTAV